MQSSATDFDQLSEEAMQLIRRRIKRMKKSAKRKLIGIEVENLKKSLDEVTNARLSTSQQ